MLSWHPVFSPLAALSALLCLAELATSSTRLTSSSDDDVTLSADQMTSSSAREVPKTQWPKPCCLPYRFTAIITPLSSFNVHTKQVMRLYRDWERRLQIQDIVSFNSDGINQTIHRSYVDYKQKLQYSISSTKCDVKPVSYGMLEPCMPDSAQYVGSSYLGLFDDVTKFQTWHFRREDKNRDMEMTIMVTSDRCVPVVEHIVGRLGGATTDTLVMFSNISRTFPDSVFDVPKLCDAQIRQQRP